MKEMWGSTKRNNVGMSLVEVVAAIAILSIVILAVLQSFVYSARYNARSRERQQTTAAAQTVMENFKAYSVQEIYDQFVSYDPNVSGSGYHLNGGLGSYYEGVPGGYLKFEISHMQYQEELYDVRIDVFPHGSEASQVSTLIYEPPTQEHAAAYVGYAGMDADALRGIMGEVAEKWTEHERAALGGGAPGTTPDPSATSVPAITHSPAEVDSSKIHITSRDLRIDIDDSTGNYVAKVSCAYTYDVTDYPYIKDTHGGTDTFSLSGQTYEMDLSDDNSMSKEIFNQASALECLNLYYYPAYRYVPAVSGLPGADSPVRIGEDHIYINNSSDTDIKCYIYKQKNLAVSDARLSTAENVYEVNLHLNGADVYDDNLNVMLGSDTGTIVDSKIHVSGNGSRYHGIGYAAAYANYPTVGNVSPALPTAMPLETVQDRQIMYDIEIAIYESGLPRQEPLNTLKGTIID